MSLIEWIHLDEAELIKLCMYETYVHEKTDDVLRLDNVYEIDNLSICEVQEGAYTRLYWYRQANYEDAMDMIDIDKRMIELPPTNDWWELDEEELSDLYLDDTVCLSGTYHPLTEFALAVNEYGEDIFYLDTKEYRYFFFKSSWKLLIEEDC